MGRLTKKEASGKWQVDGIPWEKIRKGETITEDISQRLYGCLCKLKDYEDTGMSPQQMQNWICELESMAGHVCDELCRHPNDARDQKELDQNCEDCPVSVCRGKLLGLTEKEKDAGSSEWRNNFMERFCRVD